MATRKAKIHLPEREDAATSVVTISTSRGATVPDERHQSSARVPADIDVVEWYYYRKDSFSTFAAPELLAAIVANNDLVLMAIGD